MLNAREINLQAQKKRGNCYSNYLKKRISYEIKINYKTKIMKVLKWIGIAFVVLIVLGLLLPDSDKNGKATTDTVATETAKEDIEVIN